LQNSKSEYRQLIDYINNNRGNTRSPVKKKKRQKELLDTVEIDNRLKVFFNIGHIQKEEIFEEFIRNTLKNDIVEETLYEKSFFTCSEITGCHRKVYYEYLNYECDISENVLHEYKDYLIKTNFRNILLEICNFENNQIIINHKNKIKDIISAIQNNIMIDFNCNSSLNIDSFMLKAVIYNIGKDLGDKLKFIKIISFGNSFDDISITELEVCTSSVLLEKLNLLRNNINTKNIPNITTNVKNCGSCMYKKFCDDKKETVTSKKVVKEKTSIKNSDLDDKKAVVKLRNKFLF
jgi:hypothetical protein